MKYLKNPFLILAFGLTILFFIPFPKEYLAIKIVVALLVISYGISLGAFNRKKAIDKNKKDFNERLDEIETKLEQLEAKTNKNGS